MPARPAVAAAAALVGLSLALGGEARAANVKDAPDEAPRPLFFRAFTDAGVGIGLRFNNPYRLATILGSNAESVSRTAPYSSLGAGILFGDPFGFQHGALLRWDAALSGVGQHVLTPSYVFARRGTTWGGHARLGIPLVLNPEATAGFELGLAGTFYVRAGVGVRAEFVGSVFGGAAIDDKNRTIYPVLSGQLGVVYEWERLP